MRVMFVAALAVSATLLAIPAAALAKPARPNVVFVITDDQDWHSMWAMPKTRHLIGGSGTTFDHSFISFSLCCPSRATLLTGQYAHNHGVKWNNWPLGGFRKLRGAPKGVRTAPNDDPYSTSRRSSRFHQTRCGM